ncbi:LPS assembly lipoprotein LptE [Pseudoponticoccus marisrubri]|uniref:LPS-assembly lipoprotein n=1 Tax=Pseudoponticoccus marisrubri TaxID=1685382 RepID=A0A0W7WKD9_9RHOB|nr:LPS assembly lipoprotein LptE [Pseudoponticoccus marisrubri]KUF11075.1 hypothetical protein AVJ23_08435 [Pseudoponticoccus marisrubri]
MWLSDRRTLLLAALALGACGFTPVYGPQGSGGTLVDSVLLPEPGRPESYLFNRRFEERLGRAPATAPYRLTLQLQTTEQGIGSTSAGSTTRFRVIGRAFYTLTDTATEAVLAEGRTNAFTGYSTTGSTVATLAAERDATERLMVLLADQVIDHLLLETAAEAG